MAGEVSPRPLEHRRFVGVERASESTPASPAPGTLGSPLPVQTGVGRSPAPRIADGRRLEVAGGPAARIRLGGHLVHHLLIGPAGADARVPRRSLLAMVLLGGHPLP